MDLRERKHGLRSTSWDDGHGKPVESCLALHEMDLKPFSRNCGQVPPNVPVGPSMDGEVILQLTQNRHIDTKTFS